MTDEQFNKFMQVQLAQLAMLQSMANNAQVMAANSGKAAGHNWKDIEEHLKSARELIKKL